MDHVHGKNLIYLGYLRIYHQNSYNVEVYARNLEKSSSNSRTITYGGPVPNSGDSNCPNINEDMAQINLAVQITE